MMIWIDVFALWFKHTYYTMEENWLPSRKSPRYSSCQLQKILPYLPFCSPAADEGCVAAWLLEPLTMDTKRFRDAHLLLMLAVCCCPQDVSESSQWPNTNPFLSITDIFFLVILAGRSLKKQLKCNFCLFLHYMITSIDSAGQQELFVSL